MLTRLTIQNFQSLRDVRLTTGRFTALVGRSSSGKSAVVRALSLLAHNQRGTAYVTEGQSIATVAADLGNMTVAVRRGKGTSEYIVGTGASATEKFTKCGTSVPDEVAALMGFAEVEGMDLNFSGQFDAPFLLDVPGSKVAKVLGDLTQVNLLYEASREANRRRREVSGKAKAASEEVGRLRESLQQYRDLPERAAVLTSARERRAALQEMATTVLGLREAADRAERVASARQMITQRLDKIPEIDTAALDRLVRTDEKIVALRDAAEKIEALRARSEEIQSRLALPEVSVDDLDALSKKALLAETLRATAKRMDEIVFGTKTMTTRIEALDEEIVRAQETVMTLFEEHGCPLCERPWSAA